MISIFFLLQMKHNGEKLQINVHSTEHTNIGKYFQFMKYQNIFLKNTEQKRTTNFSPTTDNNRDWQQLFSCKLKLIRLILQIDIENIISNTNTNTNILNSKVYEWNTRNFNQ